MSDTIQLATCLDANFALPLATLLASLDTQTISPTQVNIVHSGFDAELKQKVEAPLRALSLSWIEVEEEHVSGAYYSDSLTPATLFRLLLGEVLPVGLDRVVYLDSDMLVLQPPDELFAQDLGQHSIGAVRDAANPWASGPLGAPWRQLCMDPASPYFNAGVLVIDLARWRAEDVGRRSLRLLRQKQPRWGDQDALNAVLEGRWQELPRPWNLQTADLSQNSVSWALWRSEVETAVADPAILHFTGMTKPWQFGSDHPATQRWLDAVDRTSWAGWRPQAPRAGRWEQLGRKAVGMARTLRSRHAAPPLPR